MEVKGTRFKQTSDCDFCRSVNNTVINRFAQLFYFIETTPIFYLDGDTHAIDVSYFHKRHVLKISSQIWWSTGSNLNYASGTNYLKGFKLYLKVTLNTIHSGFWEIRIFTHRALWEHGHLCGSWHDLQAEALPWCTGHAQLLADGGENIKGKASVPKLETMNSSKYKNSLYQEHIYIYIYIHTHTHTYTHTHTRMYNWITLLYTWN